jgi:hypothetical protein
VWLRQHLGGKLEHLIHRKRPGKEANPGILECGRGRFWGLCCRGMDSWGRENSADIVAGAPEHENRQLWKLGVQLGNESGITDSLHGMGCDHKSKLVSEFGLLDDAECV